MTRTITDTPHQRKRRGKGLPLTLPGVSLRRRYPLAIALLLLVLSPIAMNDTRLLAPCPSSPNCVSSLADDQQQRIPPLTVADSREASLKRLEQVLAQQPRVDFERIGRSRIQARFTSRVLRFIDDVTFYVRDNGIVEVRSASRVGYWDFGANRRRVESLREQLSLHHDHD